MSVVTLEKISGATGNPNINAIITAFLNGDKDALNHHTAMFKAEKAMASTGLALAHENATQVATSIVTDARGPQSDGPVRS